MHALKIIFILLFCQSSFAKMTVDDLRLRFVGTYKVDLNENFNSGQLVDEPKGARVILAELEFLNKEFNRQRDCIAYKVPTAKKSGELLFIRGEQGSDCKQRVLSPPYFSLKDIYNLSMNLTLRELVFKIDTKKLTLDFFNLRLKDLKTHEAYNFKVPGVEVSFVERVNLKNSELLDLEICQDVSSDCSREEKNLCHLCPNNGVSYMVYASSCKANPIRRYCGKVDCGEPGNPACIRGRRAVGYTGDYCIADSPLGFCKPPARVICLNGELYCE